MNSKRSKAITWAGCAMWYWLVHYKMHWVFVLVCKLMYMYVLSYSKTHLLNWYIFMPRWAEPQRHTVVVCVCLSIRLNFQVMFFYNAWNLSAKTCLASKTCNSLIKKYWTDFRFKALLSTYIVCHDVLTSTAVASNPESSEEQIIHNWLLICTTNQLRLDWNLDNETAKKLHSVSFVYISITSPHAIIEGVA